MKIVVYGVSCAGKDIFIQQILHKFTNLKHIKGSDWLKKLAFERYNCEFEILNFESQEEIRRLFVEEIKNLDNIVVDGHYCFPENDSYKIVFTEADREIYDIFFYLFANSKEVVKRISTSEKNKKYIHLTEKNIHDWQQKEICELRDMCFENEKEFIIFDENLDMNLKFLQQYFSNYEKFMALSISDQIATKIIQNVQKTINNNKIAFFDCDGTVIKENATISFFDINNKDTSELKQIFNGDIYSLYQFWREKEIYKDFKKFPDEYKFTFNRKVLEKLYLLRQNGFKIYGITSGVFQIWCDINCKLNIFDDIIGSGFLENDIIITDFVKGYVVKKLQDRGFEVFATGDSLCDIYMLEVSSGLIWSPGKTRTSVQLYFDTHEKTAIKQYKSNQHKYDKIRSEQC